MSFFASINTLVEGFFLNILLILFLYLFLVNMLYSLKLRDYFLEITNIITELLDSFSDVGNSFLGLFTSSLNVISYVHKKSPSLMRGFFFNNSKNYLLITRVVLTSSP